MGAFYFSAMLVVRCLVSLIFIAGICAHFPIRCVPFPDDTTSDYCGDSLPATTCVRDYTGEDTLRGNASIYNQQQFEYMNSDAFKASLCEADPDSVPGYPTPESLCVSQSCETSDDCYALFLLWNYDETADEYEYGIPDRCLDYCIHCAKDEYEETSCEFEFEHAMGVSNSENCQDPTKNITNSDSSEATTTPEDIDSVLPIVVVSGVIFGLIVLGTIIIVVVVVIIKKKKSGTKEKFDISPPDEGNLDAFPPNEEEDEDEEIII